MKKPNNMIGLLLVIIILLLLKTTTANAQKWWIPTTKEALSYVGMGLAGVSYGFNQSINHHGYGNGNDFIDINTSWKRKYRNYDGGDTRPAYFGSKTILVWTTDLNHLSATVDKGFLMTSTALNFWDIKQELKGYRKKDRWKVIAFKKILFPIIIRGIAFETTFKNL